MIQLTKQMRVFTAGALLIGLAGCGAAPTPKVGLNSGATNSPYSDTFTSLAANTSPSLSNGETAGPEAFSPSQYGVAASPRVANGIKVQRGGGYQKLGKSYVVKGKRYQPTANQPPFQTGRASWYGNAFHGRLTANGEVFDMNHLTAAHKTMPLPSYAKVTNTANGRSIVVRVNDRGPFSNDRIIDLSKRGAEALDYIRAGTAHVKVEYIGPAPLHGNDDQFLISSINNPSPQLASAGITTLSGYIDWRISEANGSDSAPQMLAGEGANSAWKSKDLDR